MERELAPNTPDEEIREGEGEPNSSAKKKTAKKVKVKGKKDTEIEKGPVGSEGVTKANRPKGMPSLDKEEEVEDGCGCDHKKKSKKDAAPLTAGQVKNDACWKGYVQQGMKMKGGKRVPNCVPAGAKKKKDAAKADGSCRKKDKKSVWADGYELDAETLSIETRSLATDKNKSASRKPNAFSSVHNKIIAGTYNT